MSQEAKNPYTSVGCLPVSREVRASRRGMRRVGKYAACIALAAAGVLAGGCSSEGSGVELQVQKQGVGSGSPNLVIAEIFGGGESASSPLKSDYVVVFNRSTEGVELIDVKLQYASAAGNFTNSTTGSVPLSAESKILGPGKYYFVKLRTGDYGVDIIPPPDAEATTQVSATAGKFALIHGTPFNACGNNPTTNPCVPIDGVTTVLDFVGFGTSANQYEGIVGAAPAPSATTAIFRKGGGCVDTDDNKNDFEVDAPSPDVRYSGTPAQP
ncbi:MAG: lamin tail domain-containing protein, partial [Polyangiaceae bacterium]|nr:lamin tail domain-containing protein [Polyangiaceae bacterium]